MSDDRLLTPKEVARLQNPDEWRSLDPEEIAELVAALPKVEAQELHLIHATRLTKYRRIIATLQRFQAENDRLTAKREREILAAVEEMIRKRPDLAALFTREHMIETERETRGPELLAYVGEKLQGMLEVMGERITALESENAALRAERERVLDLVSGTGRDVSLDTTGCTVGRILALDVSEVPP